MEPLKTRISYSNKRTSSGRIVDGEIRLVISSRASRNQQMIHIDSLSKRLNERAAKLLSLPLPTVSEDCEPIRICSNDELEVIADLINDEYYHVEYTGVSFKVQRSRWGSYSLATKRIYISERLRGAPRPLVEYVLCHELSHVIQPDHCRLFWFHVSKACSDYRLRREQLSAYDLRLSLDLPVMTNI